MRWLLILAALACLSQVIADRNVIQDNQIARARYQGGINVAVKGAYATTGNTPDNTPPYNFTARGWQNTFWDLSQQVDHIISIHRAYPIANDSIHVVWVGINDLYRNGKVDVNLVVSSIDTQVHRLWNETDARQFVLLNVHDLTQTPAGKKAWTGATATTVQTNIVAFNTELTALVAKLNSEGGSAVLVDVASIISTLAQNSALNVVDACYNRATGALCGSPAAFLYWDDVHLTSFVAQQVASATFSTIQATFPNPAPASYQWFMYGDDASDQGNNDAVAQTFGLRYPIQPAPYNGTGTWSDADVMPAYLGVSLSARLSLSHSTRVIPLQRWGGGVNFATGGSMTSAPLNGQPSPGINLDTNVLQLLRVRGSPVPWDFTTEINQGVKRGGLTAPIRFHPDALHVVWIGGNDYLHQPNAQLDYNATATAVVNHVKDIATRIGATRFVIGLMPDLGKTPVFVSRGVGPLFHNISIQHNDALQAGINAWAAQTPGLQIAWMDAYTAINLVMANPAAYGFADVMSPCFNQVALTLCNNAQSPHLFWDGAHPTTQAHQLLANFTYQALESFGIHTNSIPQFFTWGDSLSDPGNIYGVGKYINPTIFYPPPPYAAGHFSNGAAFGERFGQFLGLTQTNIVDIIGREIPPRVIVVPTGPRPVPYPATAGVPPSPPIADKQILAYTLPIRITPSMLQRGDSLNVVVTRLAKLVATAMQLDPDDGNVIISANGPSYTGTIMFRDANATYAYAYAAHYADATTRSAYIYAQPDLADLIVTSSVISASSVAVVPCGDGGYHAVDNPYCSDMVLPAPTLASTSSSNNTPLIVGLVVGLVGGFIALLVFYFALSWCLDRKAQTRHTDKSHEMTAV